jgi:hypothetical protein
MEVKNGKLIGLKNCDYPSEFGDIIYHFYEHAQLDRGYSVRVDLLLIYDTKKLIKAKKINFDIKDSNNNLKNYLYKFKDQDNKKDALLAVVKILR